MYTYQQFLEHAVDPNAQATVDDLANIPDDDVYEIYKTMYWDKVWGDKLPDGLDFAMFDFAVNSGPARAVKELQKNFFGCTTDGIMGSQTFGKIEETINFVHPGTWQTKENSLGRKLRPEEDAEFRIDQKILSVEKLIQSLTDNRVKFLRTLKHYDHFGRGWERRCDKTNRDAINICENISAKAINS
jgi:lysozyme family protein